MILHGASCTVARARTSPTADRAKTVCASGGREDARRGNRRAQDAAAARAIIQLLLDCVAVISVVCEPSRRRERSAAWTNVPYYLCVCDCTPSRR